MTVRPAETRDIPAVLMLFVALLDYLKQQNPNYNVTSDRDRLIGAVLHQIVTKMQAPDHIVLVLEEDGAVTHFCAGGIARMPEFYEYTTLAELNWFYPLSTKIKPLVDAFDVWGLEQGATTRWGFASPNSKGSQALMARDGMKLDTLQYLKVYKE
jgi:hypothetical protein